MSGGLLAQDLLSDSVLCKPINHYRTLTNAHASLSLVGITTMIAQIRDRHHARAVQKSSASFVRQEVCLVTGGVSASRWKLPMLMVGCHRQVRYKKAMKSMSVSIRPGLQCNRLALTFYL